jgi:lipid II:glycine glycyltransferase (peptidoglycan interpeptide bridge formation enzyme)
MENRSAFKRFLIFVSFLKSLTRYSSIFVREFIKSYCCKRNIHHLKDCNIRQITSRDEWENLYLKCSKPHISQSWVFGESKRKAEKWNPKHFAFEYDERVVAICMVLKKNLFGVFVISRIGKGPLFLEEYPSEEVRLAVYKKLRSMWKYLFNGILFIAPALEVSPENNEILRDTRFWKWSPEKWHSSLIDLKPDENEMRKALGKGWRNRLNSAERYLKLHISSSTQEMDWMMERHCENMQQKNFKGPSVDFLKAIYQTDPDNFILLQAIYENEPIAGFVNFKQCQLAEIYIGWVGPLGREYNAGNFIFWNSSLVMKERGCRVLDLGGFSINDKYGQFKRGMQGAEYELSGEYICF